MTRPFYKRNIHSSIKFTKKSKYDKGTLNSLDLEISRNYNRLEIIVYLNPLNDTFMEYLATVGSRNITFGPTFS